MDGLVKLPAELLRTAREKSKRTQEDVAADLGVTQPLVSKWETDKEVPFLGDVKRVAQTYGVNESTLLKAVVARAERRAIERRKDRAS